MTERWLPIADFPSYEVSDMGRVRRVAIARNSKPGRILRAGWRGRYLAVDLCQDGRRTTCNVHRLVAAAFLVPDESRPEVNHRNGVRDDCRASNLEWSTRRENAQHAHRLNLQDCRGERNGQAKLTAEQVISILARRSERRGASVAIARESGVSPTTVRDIWRGRTWGTVRGAA